MITTPLSSSAWESLLAEHPHQELVRFFISGISNGFRIGFKHTNPVLKQAWKNMESANAHKDVVSIYLQEELTKGRVAGPIAHSLISYGQISRFGVIPKHHKPDSWRLIIDLSHPHNHRINDGIPSSLCLIKYISIDYAINQIFVPWKRNNDCQNRYKECLQITPGSPC